MDGIWSARRHGDHLECLTSKGKKILKSYRAQQQQQLIGQKQQRQPIIITPQQKPIPVQEKLRKEHPPKAETPTALISVRNNKQQSDSGNNISATERLQSSDFIENIPCNEPPSVTFANSVVRPNSDIRTVMACDDQGPLTADSESAFLEKTLSSTHASPFTRICNKVDQVVDQSAEVKSNSTELHQKGSSCVVSIEGNEEEYEERGGEEDKMIIETEEVTIRPKNRSQDWLCRAGVSVRWSGVSVSVSGKTLLSGVSGHCAPGHIFAVMGPSGSGKTTLLNALSGRVRCEGSVCLGEHPLSRKLRHLVGYSTQHDLFHPHLRLRQMLQFTADLRLPATLSKEQKTAAVDSVISMLALTQCQNTIIGDASTRGLSGGERKRASIACELLTDPPVLVLDEPTSGLDAHAAHSLISQLKTLAVSEGRAVILSLHQPSSRVFHMLDTVLLLSGGRPAYLGPSKDVASYLAKLGLPLQPHYNPADFLLEVANDHSELLVRHFEGCREDGDTQQSTSPPQWVFQQHLSSLSSESNSKSGFHGHYQGEKPLMKDVECTRISSLSLPENERIPRTCVPDISSPVLCEDGRILHKRISSTGLLEDARVSSHGYTNTSSPPVTIDHYPSLPDAKTPRLSNKAKITELYSDVVGSLGNEFSHQRRLLSDGVQRCACGNLVSSDRDGGDSHVPSVNLIGSEGYHVAVGDSFSPSIQGGNNCSNYTANVDDKHSFNGVIESTNLLANTSAEPNSNHVPNSAKDYPSYVSRNPSQSISENLAALPRLLSCPKCAVRRGQDLHDTRSGLDPTNDSHDSGYDQNRDHDRLCTSFRGCELQQSLRSSFSRDPVLTKSRIPSDDTSQECPLVNGTRNRSVRRDESDSGRESCSSDHSEAASCLATSVLPFSSSRRISPHGTPGARWPASYWTQCRVLTARCYAVYRPIITSKINWVQTLGFALLAGVLWFQAPRTEEGITDLQGWMFFSTSYWMMHSHFQALNTFPREKAVLEKERSSGWYRISAYYIAKSISELPLTVALPSLYFVISYPLMGFSGVSVMMLLLLMLLLNALVAQSLGLLVSVTFCNIEHCWAVSALITLFQQLFGGYLATRVPPWMEWARYLSMVQYAYSNMCFIEFSMGPPVTCAPELSRYPSCASGNTDTVPVDEILAASGGGLATSTEVSPVWINTTALLLYLITARLLAYLVLRFRYRPNY